MPNVRSIAVDTNVLLDLAAEDETVLDCFATIRKRIPACQFVVLPTVIIELTDIAESGIEDDRKLALKAFSNLLNPWKFVPLNYIPVGHGIVEQIGQKLRDKGLIPENEAHDSFIVAEAALCGVTILISSDAHIKDIDASMLKIELDSSDAGCPLIASPWKIVNDFWKKKD
jgi:predicted nucleic-acid-binding protein